MFEMPAARMNAGVALSSEGALGTQLDDADGLAVDPLAVGRARIPLERMQIRGEVPDQRDVVVRQKNPAEAHDVEPAELAEAAVLQGSVVEVEPVNVDVRRGPRRPHDLRHPR